MIKAEQRAQKILRQSLTLKINANVDTRYHKFL